MNKLLVFFLPLMLVLSGCQSDKLDIDVENIDLPPVQLLRLDDDLFSLEESNFEVRSREIRERYGVTYEYYLMNPHRLNGTADTAYKPAILAFVNDRDVRGAYNDIKKLYSPDVMDKIKDEVNNCRKRFKYHFPKRKMPSRLITCLSGWNYAFAYMDSSLLISLDMYMGDTSRYYQMLRTPQYQARVMDSYHIVSDIARGWLLTELDTAKPENTLLNHTIFYGKLYYGVKALVPQTEDSLIIGYSSKQMKLCDQYEKQYWSYMAEKNRLYDNNLMTIRELTSEGPFTAAISKECPPRIAMYIGWQIVRSYMKNNPEVTLEQLMSEQDAQKILSKSKYRP